MAILSSLRTHLAQLIANCRSGSVVGQKKNGYSRQSIRPSIRKLEPRLVLNASAELTSLGQLLITGTDAADYVRIDVNSSGQITLQNEFGARIDIVGNPNGQTEPLNPDSIFSKQIQINLLGGNDTLDLAIPSGINVSVMDGDGNDNIKITRFDSPLANESATHQLVAQSIRFDDSLQPLDWRNQNFRLTGDVYIGSSFSTLATEILIDGGSWEVSGRLILQSDVDFLANSLGGSLDLSETIVTADSPAVTLTIDIGQTESSDLKLGSIDNSGSEQLENITVKSASNVLIQSPTLDLTGALTIQNISSKLNITSQISASNISLQASAVEFHDSSLVTESGDIHIDGPVILYGALDVQTNGGDVTFTGTIDGNYELAVDTGTGIIELQDDLGRIDPLSGVRLTGSAITVHSLVVIDSDITLDADRIALVGSHISTLQSGDVLLGAPITVHATSVDIRSSGSIHFASTMQGQLGNESLVVTAGNSILLNGPVNRIDSLSLQAMMDISLMGTVEVNQDFSALANQLTVTQNITTNLSSDGSLVLSGTSLFTISPGVEISIGTGELETQGPITILGDLNLTSQGGNILLASSIDGIGVLSVANTGGRTVVQEAIGLRQPLAGVNLQSGQLSVNTVIVEDSEIVLSANEIQYTGQMISTLGSGNVVVNGDLTTTLASASITSADSVQINGTISGNLGMENLIISAKTRIDLENGAQQIGSLNLLANNTIETSGLISVNQNFSANSDNVVISGDISMSPDNVGAITLVGNKLVRIDSMATLSIGNGTLSITTDGVVDLANSTIVSDSITATVSLSNASIITLGNIDLDKGSVNLQTLPQHTATIKQAIETSILVSRLKIISGGDVVLENLGNNFQFIDDLNVRGDLRIRDDVGDLTIASTLVLGTTVDVSTASTLYLLDNAITAEQANVRLNAGTSVINSAFDLNQSNITGKTLTMTALSGIGSVAPIQLRSILSLDVTTVTGGIDLEQQTSTDTIITQLSAQSGLVRFEQSGQSTVAVQSIVSGQDGISVINNGGSIDIAISPMNGNTITGGEFGSIFLKSSGFIRMPDGARIDADRGTISLVSVGDITIGGLKTTGTDAKAVEVVSMIGSIIDGGDQDIDIDANNGGVVLKAFSGIGSGNPLETAIDRLSSSVSSTGSIKIVESDSINLLDLITEDGTIYVIADGTITATNVASVNTFQNDDSFGASQSRDITLYAQGPTSDILVRRIAAYNFADVLLVAGDDVLGIADGTTVEVIADDLEIIAGNSTDDGILAIGLSTDINDLLLTVSGATRGDAEIREFNSLSLASSDMGSDTHRLQTTNGEIRIIAGDSIFLFDLDQQNDLTAPLADPEVIAGGLSGRLVFIAGNAIELGNQTQIVAAQSTPNAVRFESKNVVFGETIEINTGSGVGIAKYFLPRPAIDEQDTAFYDATTIRTDTLTQENAKDAKGFLTVKIGLPGERGLQVDIDWGAPTNRFQRITDISADNSRLVDGIIDVSGPMTDDPRLQVSHVYLESDIVNSVLNGRTSATGPLNVRFSVSHHESIVIQADNVTQDFDEYATPLSVDVSGRLVSSTDNPLTAGVLESGTARFIIPNLSIPVAFFPVREIIPESIKIESLVRPLEAVLLSTGSLDQESGSASSLVVRDEFFQMRILSPDPFGEDLADPKRLPDDILSGDKLRRLFQQLPDGRYEIGYVFGDGNVRSLLMIDNRNGVTKVLGQEIQGGPLRLERLMPLEIETQPTIEDLPDAAVPVEEIPKPSESEIDKEVSNEKNGTASLTEHGISPSKSSFDSFSLVLIVGGFMVNRIPVGRPNRVSPLSAVNCILKHSRKTVTPINRFSRVGRFLSSHNRSPANG